MNKLSKNAVAWWRYFNHRGSIDRNNVILKFDGGICSQIAFWALAHELTVKGFNVKYDLSWYKENGKDMDGVHARNFDLPLILPSIAICEANEVEIYLYKKKYRFRGSTFGDLSSPAYLGDYFDRWPLVLKYRKLIRELFQLNASVFSAALINSIEFIRSSPNNCAVHVRRGDLSVFNPVYGDPISAEYFVKAINLVKERSPSSIFLLFSDEPDWVARNIVPNIPNNVTVELMDANDSSKGYLDLYLMCQCNHFIASQGSLAKYAMAISGSEDSIIVEPKSSVLFQSKQFPNAFSI